MQYTKKTIQGVSLIFFIYLPLKCWLKKRSEFKTIAHLTFLFLCVDMYKIFVNLVYGSFSFLQLIDWLIGLYFTPYPQYLIHLTAKFSSKTRLKNWNVSVQIIKKHMSYTIFKNIYNMSHITAFLNKLRFLILHSSLMHTSKER